MSDFDDFDLPTLITMRREARLAKHALLTGKKAASLGEANGSGSKSVTYQQADLPALSAYIQELDDEISRRQTGGGRGGRHAFYIT